MFGPPKKLKLDLDFGQPVIILLENFLTGHYDSSLMFYVIDVNNTIQ